MKFLLLSILLIGAAMGNDEQEKNVETALLNDYIDTIMPALKDFAIKYLDPMDIPDLMEGFSVKPLFIEYHGELELTEGQLTGLSSLWRSGDFKVMYLNKLLRVTGDFGFKDLGFTYKYLAKIMGIGPTGGIIGKVSKLSGVMDLMIDFNNNELHLQDFYLHDVGSITIKFTGNILVDWLSGAIANVVTTLFKNVIVKIVEANLRNVIQQKLDELNAAISGTVRMMAEYPNYSLNSVLKSPPNLPVPVKVAPSQVLLQKIMPLKNMIKA